MIKQSPESPMPEPYKTYIQQRSENIAEVLEPVVGGTDVQLVPRAILPGERIFKRRFRPDNSIVYGSVVDKPEDGLKSVLYRPEFSNIGAGTVVYSLDDALAYSQELFASGERVRVKEPAESDGDGQSIASSPEELAAIISHSPHLSTHGLVLMPHFATITDRYSLGYINLGKHGAYRYAGREDVVVHNGREVFGGGNLVLTADTNKQAERNRLLDIPPRARQLGAQAFKAFRRIAKGVGRVSFDVIEGTTDSGRLLTALVDITPRVGGHTPAETLAIAALSSSRNTQAVVAAKGKLLYNPDESPSSGRNFVDTPGLVINAEVYAME